VLVRERVRVFVAVLRLRLRRLVAAQGRIEASERAGAPGRGRRGPRPGRLPRSVASLESTAWSVSWSAIAGGEAVARRWSSVAVGPRVPWGASPVASGGGRRPATVTSLALRPGTAPAHPVVTTRTRSLFCCRIVSRWRALLEDLDRSWVLLLGARCHGYVPLWLRSSAATIRCTASAAPKPLCLRSRSS